MMKDAEFFIMRVIDIGPVYGVRINDNDKLSTS